MAAEALVARDASGRRHARRGRWVEGSAWRRFGLYNCYVVVRGDGRVLKMPAHAGELVPGSTEDLVAVLRTYDPDRGHPPAPLTLELDPTYRCASRDCGGACFSADYRRRAPTAAIPGDVLHEIVSTFASEGGRVLRFDGGGDPLLHPDVRSGALVELAARHGLKTTILTSGDLLASADLDRIADSGCYVRVSLNAATDATRMAFHGNAVPLAKVLGATERLARRLADAGSEVPVGATFLLGAGNYQEVLQAALRARDAGVRHFSVRRVLGPPAVRPQLDSFARARLRRLLHEVAGLHGDDFRVAVPWRPVDEPDLDPSAGDFAATRCWQSTFKTFVEPDPTGSAARGQLCGRYRGGGIGQRMQLPTLFRLERGHGWVGQWRRSFTDYPVPRTDLPRTCVSCIDRGFILMVQRLLDFVGVPLGDFEIHHFDSPEPEEVQEWQALAPPSC